MMNNIINSGKHEKTVFSSCFIITKNLSFFVAATFVFGFPFVVDGLTIFHDQDVPANTVIESLNFSVKATVFRPAKGTRIIDSDGVTSHDQPIIIVEFSSQAKDATLNLFNNNTNKRLLTSNTPKDMPSKWRTGFMFYLDSPLEPNFEYRYVLTGKDFVTGKNTSKDGIFFVENNKITEECKNGTCTIVASAVPKIININSDGADGYIITQEPKEVAKKKAEKEETERKEKEQKEKLQKEQEEAAKRAAEDILREKQEEAAKRAAEDILRGKQEEPVACAQVMTLGKKKSSNEYREFSSACLPDGWELVTFDIAEAQEYLNRTTKETEEIKNDHGIQKINKKEKPLQGEKQDKAITEKNQTRYNIKEREAALKYLKQFSGDFKKITKETHERLALFITYGIDENSKKLGEGERAAALHSYKVAFKKMPDSENEISDIIKIANGHFPTKRSSEAEQNAKLSFRKIYKRIANMSNSYDSAAIMIIAYGLRQQAKNRNIVSERVGINTFRAIFGNVPKKTEEWNIMQAITYSGASRKLDTDKDFLSDEDEKLLGTDPHKRDTDGDGYTDGDEVENGYNSLGV